MFGIDLSAVMCAQAAHHNAAAIRAGRVALTVASIETLPPFDRPFDKILAVNNMGMWSDPVQRLKELRDLLRDGGVIAIVSQPRCPGATAQTTDAAASEIVDALSAAGFVAIRVKKLDLKPPVACVVGAAGAGQIPRACNPDSVGFETRPDDPSKFRSTQSLVKRRHLLGHPTVDRVLVGA